MRKLTKAETKALSARIKDLEKQGIKKEIAEAMAWGELSAGLIKPVVN